MSPKLMINYVGNVPENIVLSFIQIGHLLFFENSDYCTLDTVLACYHCATFFSCFSFILLANDVL